MDRNVLKKFAVESRYDLMQKVKNKINLYYINETFNKSQNGDIFVLNNGNHTLNLTKDEYEKRELLIKRIKELGYEQVIEESAYTWFNRIVAIRYMEINNYLPLSSDNQGLGIRILSSEDNKPDPEILKFTNLINPDLDILFNKEKYITFNNENEKFKYILLLICKKLANLIPQVFGGITDYIDILMPDNMLSDTGFITKLLKDIPEDDFNQVEIIGWLYQFYNQNEKDRVMGEKSPYKKNEIPYATQLFTPDWIVKYLVENSLGRYWIEHNGVNVELTKNWKYFVEENIENLNEKIKPTELKVIDPCCGSGHILVYAFDLLVQIYSSCGYSKSDIPKIILLNNLNGLDIDDRAGQLSILSLMLKAREYDKDIFKKINARELNIMSFQESNNIDSSIINEISESNQEILNYLVEEFKNAKEIGSLIRLEKKETNELEDEILNNHTIFGYILNEKVLPLIKQYEILNKKYNIVITNPPYAIKAKLGSNLYNFLNNNYKNFSNDLFTAFIKKVDDLLIPDGKYAMITPHSWMTLGDLINIRMHLLENHHISSMAHMGVGAFGADFGTTAFVIDNYKNLNSKSLFIDLGKWQNSSEKEENFKNAQRYNINQNDFLILPNKAIAYFASERLLENFKEELLEKYVVTREGMTTGCNDLFLRFWYEVENNKNDKWINYNKGGYYRKWFGNNEYVVNWENDGYEIKNFKDEKTGRTRSHNYNGEFIKKEGITWGAFSSVGASFRYSNKNTLFDSKGSMAFPKDDKLYYYLGFLNSKVSQKYLEFISGTRDTKPGHISLLPIKFSEKSEKIVENLVKENIELEKEDWDSFETSYNFKSHPLIKEKNKFHYGKINGVEYKISDCFNHYYDYTVSIFDRVKSNEENINKEFINLYNLESEISYDLNDNDITIIKAERLSQIKSLISYYVGCMFGRYSLDNEGLIYAGGELKENNYSSFKIDEDNIIPITDEAYFGDDIVSRFKQFIEVVFGKETLNENIDFIAETLGKKGTETSEETIRRYFLNDFYADHIKMYQKKPIYWLFDSGKKNGFKALIYMHRYNENTVPKVRLDYLHRIQTTYEKLLTDINYKLTTDLSMIDKKEAQKRQVDLNNKLTEIKEYDEKIAHIANQRINIDLDDGVIVNYSKFADILAKIK